MTPGTAPAEKEAAEICPHAAGRRANEFPGEPTVLYRTSKVNYLLGFLETLLCFFLKHSSEIRRELILPGNTLFKLTLKCIQEEKQIPTCKFGIF